MSVITSEEHAQIREAEARGETMESTAAFQAAVDRQVAAFWAEIDQIALLLDAKRQPGSDAH